MPGNVFPLTFIWSCLKLYVLNTNYCLHTNGTGQKYLLGGKKPPERMRQEGKRMHLMGKRREAKFTVFIPAHLVSILSALLRAANNNRGNNGDLVTPWALKASHQ